MILENQKVTEISIKNSLLINKWSIYKMSKHNQYELGEHKWKVRKIQLHNYDDGYGKNMDNKY